MEYLGAIHKARPQYFDHFRPLPLVRKRPRPQPPGRPRAVTGLQTHRYASLGNLPHLRAQQPALLEHPPSSRWFTGRSDPARL